eukprot:1690649-Pleurochrysis_carterae.AAC.2
MKHADSIVSGEYTAERKSGGWGGGGSVRERASSPQIMSLNGSQSREGEHHAVLLEGSESADPVLEPCHALACAAPRLLARKRLTPRAIDTITIR